MAMRRDGLGWHEWAGLCFGLALLFLPVAIVGAMLFTYVTSNQEESEVTGSYAPGYEYQPPSGETRTYNWWEAAEPTPSTGVPNTGTQLTPSYSGSGVDIGAGMSASGEGYGYDPEYDPNVCRPTNDPFACDVCCADGPGAYYGDPDCAITCAEECGSYCGWEGEPGPCLQLLMDVVLKAEQQYPDDEDARDFLLSAACLHLCWGVSLDTLQAQSRDSVIRDGEPCIVQAIAGE